MKKLKKMNNKKKSKNPYLKNRLRIQSQQTSYIIETCNQNALIHFLKRKIFRNFLVTQKQLSHFYIEALKMDGQAKFSTYIAITKAPQYHYLK